jgi:dTMP kinase
MYINFTGVDGSGKDTAYKKVIQHFPKAVRLREPGGTPAAEKIRSVLLDIEDTNRIKTVDELLKDEKVLNITKEFLAKAKKEIIESGIISEAEIYLYAASRAETNRVIVKPTIDKGELVLGSRSVACSMAYQGKARGFGMEKVWNINLPALNVLPDLEIYFNIPTEVAIKRLEQRTDKQDRLDLESIEFHRLSREGYEEYYKEKCPYPYEVIDATQSIDKVYEQVMFVLEKHNIKPSV